ncbi:MAG: DEAD/DEAH box helicase [Gammaproteobacteria bacterium]|nr:MAG: DEAD/DEAH box helicase [Gammaproteobacteria bacterium]
MTFEDLMLDDSLLEALVSVRFNEPTEIQAATIPLILEGKDVLAGAATGTGKTAAFVLPALQLLLDEPNRDNVPKVLILAPTRELAFQIHNVVVQLSKNDPVNAVIITGGFSQGVQASYAQDACDIIIATPGRLLNLVADEAIDLSEVDMVIIDEADRMLDMGQGPDVLALLATIADGFQACLFSATLAGTGIEIFAEELLHDAEVIQINAANAKSDQVSQSLYYADNKEHKQALLLATINNEACSSALVFCNKRERAEEITEWLQSRNVSAQVMHGDFDQAVRRDKTRKFRIGQVKVMVATDVAARGLDLTNISHVINYDLPFKGDIYIHRIGRTGRGEQKGTAINLVEHHDIKNLERIEFHLEHKLPVSKIKGLEPSSKKNKAKTKSKKNSDKPRYVSKKDRTVADKKGD